MRTQKKIMADPLYHFEVITDCGSFVGLVLWWEFDDLRYIEHLATLPNLRGKGFGSLILTTFIARSEVPVLLEVEHPTDEIGHRRIGFYQRAGFVLNSQSYSHPPYKKGGAYVPLMLMTHLKMITDEELTRFVDVYHPIIHRFVQLKRGSRRRQRNATA